MKTNENIAIEKMMQESALLQFPTDAHLSLLRSLLLVCKSACSQLGLAQLEIHVDVFIAHRGYIARPDILIPAIGLVIEVDGLCHTSERKMAIDRFTEAHVYNALSPSFHVLRPTNDDVYYRRERLIRVIKQRLEAGFLPKCVRNRIKVKIAQGRRLNQAFFESLRTSSRLCKTFEFDEQYDCDWEPLYGGMRIVLNRGAKGHGLKAA